MASLPSKFNNENNINRSDLSTMYNIDQIPLARLRPEKFDDAAIQKQILLIQEICGDINLDIIAVVFHECDYNMQNTIARIKAGDFEDGGWQTAKSNNKKKNNNLSDQILNGSTQSDSEHSRSQHTSPTPSLRGTGRRQDHYHYSSSSRTNYGRRRNDSGRNQFIPSNTHYSSRNYSNNNKSLSNQQNSNEIIPLSKTKEDITTTTTTTPPPPSSSTTDDDVFILNTTQTLTYNNSIKKLSSTKRPTPSSIPQEPVSMHPIIQCPTEPIDIQFGDIQWNDSVPIAVYPSNSSIITESLDDQKSSSITNINDDEQQTNIQDNLSSNYINDQTTNDIDRDLLETTNRLSSSSISSLSLPIMDNSIANNLAVMSLERTSHLSDHLTDSLRQQQQQQMTTSSSSLTDTTHLPPTSTSHNNNNSFISNTFSNTSNGPGGNSSAFTPYNTPGTYSSIPRDYSQAGSTWNQQSSNYKTTPKSTILQPGNYSQQASYQIQPQQQFFVGTYPYHPPTVKNIVFS
ncbi:unnamed protein product [Rotaria sordida]|uniref:Uncharacterized protein n=1 Tax=Rotaria sordida TaxID=392033 RepID=A0A818QZY5_9BILA|nr:unnamed protein product [Rotaria sordida]CAF3649584.1 unnamed protein product [Rotaria sordida]